VLKLQDKPSEALDVLRRALARGGDAERLQTEIAALEQILAGDGDDDR
jgi:hypothetical protein